ncbi:MAG: hypothetical protein FWG10_00135 [Eubacteriaceae bacterium]|nr:hypothetical protein [Eubacteriaceae bacterium]
MSQMISSQEELMRIGRNSRFPANGDYTLAGNINIDSNWAPIPAEPGFLLNGSFCTISNVRAPLFQNLWGAVCNLNVNADIRVGNGPIGAIAAFAQNGSRIENCTVRGRVTGQAQTGGVAGILLGGAVAISNKNFAQVAGQCAGGIAGSVAGAGVLITQNESDAEVSGISASGGIIGETDGESTQVSSNISRGSVESVGNAGGIVGISRSSAIANNESFASITASSNNAGGIVGCLSGPRRQEVENNTFRGARVSARLNARRIAGFADKGAPIALYGNTAIPSVLISGDNSQDGGLAYANQTIQQFDPDFSPSGLQGGNWAAPTICPPAFHLVNGRCVPVFQPEPICPPGFVWVNGRCILTIQPKPPQNCPSGCGNWHQPPQNCPSGCGNWHQPPQKPPCKGAGCNQPRPPQRPECRDGFWLVNGRCVPIPRKKNLVHDTKGCPRGFRKSKSGKRCIPIWWTDEDYFESFYPPSLENNCIQDRDGKTICK